MTEQNKPLLNYVTIKERIEKTWINNLSDLVGKKIKGTYMDSAESCIILILEDGTFFHVHISSSYDFESGIPITSDLLATSIISQDEYNILSLAAEKEKDLSRAKTHLLYLTRSLKKNPEFVKLLTTGTVSVIQDGYDNIPFEGTIDSDKLINDFIKGELN